MKVLRRILTLLMVLAFVIGYISGAYAKTASIASHVTIYVMPRAEESNIPKDEELTNFQMKNEEMITRIDEVERIKGKQSIYTMVGIL